MPLVACPECQHQVSSQAALCPSCGCPTTNAATSRSSAGSSHSPTTHQTPAPPTKLYSRGQIFASTFWGTILAGTHLTAANWRRLGKPKLANQAWIIGSLGLFVVMGLAFVIPDRAGTTGNMLLIALSLAVVNRMGKKQRALVEEQVALGSSYESGWRVLWLSVCYLAPFFALWLFAVLYDG